MFRSWLILLGIFAGLQSLCGQGICSPTSGDEIIKQRQIRMVLDSMAIKLMRKTCLVTGRNPSSQILNCSPIAAEYVAENDGKSYHECVLMEVELGWNGWTCIGPDTYDYYKVEAIIVFQGNQVIDIPQQLIQYNEACAKAERCNAIIGEVLKGDYNAMFDQLLDRFNSGD